MIRWLLLALILSQPVHADAPPGPPDADQSTQARAYLKRLEDLPADFRLGTFRPAPGIHLETGFLPARGARRGTVVFVPGYTAPLELYAQEMRALAEGGWDVAALVLRGQGRSVRLTEEYDLGHVRDYANLSHDVAAFVARQRGPVVGVGLSQGAHVLLRMAGEYDTRLRAVAAIVPMVDIRTAPLPGGAARLMADALAGNGAARRYLPGTVPWARRKPFGELLGRGNVCQPDPELAHLRRALMEVDASLRVEVPSPGWVSATFASVERLRRLTPRIGLPVLMVTAGRDGVVRTAAAAEMCDRLPDCRRAHLPRAPHCAVEGDRRRSPVVMVEVLRFLASEF